MARMGVWEYLEQKGDWRDDRRQGNGQGSSSHVAGMRYPIVSTDS